jgi:hypothetical protein
MDIDTGKRRNFPALAISAVLLVLCVIPGQFYATKLFPAISGLAQINTTLIFLEIPTPLPFTIDLILVPGLFLLIYPIVVLLYTSRPRQAIQRVGNVFVGLLALLFFMLSGGWIYYLVKDQLSERVRNGIDSLGLNADIHLSYPGFETIHLRGSMVLFVCFLIGITICIRKIRKEPGMQKAGRLTREQRMTPYDRMIQEKRMLQKGGMEKKEHNVDTSWQPVYPDVVISRHDKNVPTRLCYNQPVMTFTPLAVRYMPM